MLSWEEAVVEGGGRVQVENAQAKLMYYGAGFG